MDTDLRDRFTRLFHQSFPGSELPVAYMIGGDTTGATIAPEPKGWKCLVCDLVKVGKGASLIIGEHSLSCNGAKAVTTNKILFFSIQGNPDPRLISTLPLFQSIPMVLLPECNE
jgi:hypothetical protein